MAQSPQVKIHFPFPWFLVPCRGGAGRVTVLLWFLFSSRVEHLAAAPELLPKGLLTFITALDWPETTWGFKNTSACFRHHVCLLYVPNLQILRLNVFISYKKKIYYYKQKDVSAAGDLSPPPLRAPLCFWLLKSNEFAWGGVNFILTCWHSSSALIH